MVLMIRLITSIRATEDKASNSLVAAAVAPVVAEVAPTVDR
jgi:hypothetical protein